MKLLSEKQDSCGFFCKNADAKEVRSLYAREQKTSIRVHQTLRLHLSCADRIQRFLGYFVPQHVRIAFAQQCKVNCTAMQSSLHYYANATCCGLTISVDYLGGLFMIKVDLQAVAFRCEASSVNLVKTFFIYSYCTII